MEDAKYWGGESTSQPCHFTLWDKTHWTGAWVGPRATLDAWENRKVSCPCQNQTPDRLACSLVAILTGLSQLRSVNETKNKDNPWLWNNFFFLLKILLTESSAVMSSPYGQLPIHHSHLLPHLYLPTIYQHTSPHLVIVSHLIQP